jgi:hypothetical protein
MNNTKISESKGKRQFVKNGLVICALLTWLGILACNTVHARSVKDEMISEVEIEQLMKRGSVESILKEEYHSGLIQKVEYNRRKGKTNFDELVYQEHLNPRYRKPVLVFFYDTKIDTINADERNSIILKILINKYNDNLDFLYYDTSIEPSYTGNRSSGIFGAEVKSEAINSVPSMAMYSQFDLVKGETPNSINGRVKQIDILRGGPGKNSLLKPWLEFLKDKWIPTNIAFPNNNYAWRFSNSADEKKVIYN